jgi:hypothetical protein
VEKLHAQGASGRGKNNNAQTGRARRPHHLHLGDAFVYSVAAPFITLIKSSTPDSFTTQRLCVFDQMVKLFAFSRKKRDLHVLQIE